MNISIFVGSRLEAWRLCPRQVGHHHQGASRGEGRSHGCLQCRLTRWLKTLIRRLFGYSSLMISPAFIISKRFWILIFLYNFHTRISWKIICEELRRQTLHFSRYHRHLLMHFALRETTSFHLENSNNQTYRETWETLSDRETFYLSPYHTFSVKIAEELLAIIFTFLDDVNYLRSWIPRDKKYFPWIRTTWNDDKKAFTDFSSRL